MQKKNILFKIRKLIFKSNSGIYKKTFVITDEDAAIFAVLFAKGTGKITRISPDGKFLITALVKDGLPHFHEKMQIKTNEDTPRLQKEIFFGNNDSWLPSGKFVEYYEDGLTKKIEGSTINGLYHGEVRNYLENGELYSILTYHEGRLATFRRSTSPEIIVRYDIKSRKISVQEIKN